MEDRQSIKVLVFDFDGTLVESNQLKYDAYFELFPKDAFHIRMIRQVLASSFEESRYHNLKKILRTIDNEIENLEEEVQMLAGQYNEIVIEGAKHCPACPGTEALLQQAHSVYPLYLSSTTPEAALRDIVAFRQWARYFKAIFGYPRKKTDTLQTILQQEHVAPEQVLVIGDGESDRASAAHLGAHFWDVNERPLLEILSRPELELMKIKCLSE